MKNEDDMGEKPELDIKEEELGRSYFVLIHNAYLYYKTRALYILRAESSTRIVNEYKLLLSICNFLYLNIAISYSISASIICSHERVRNRCPDKNAPIAH